MTINVVINSWNPFTYQLPEKTTRFVGLVHIILPPFNEGDVTAIAFKFILQEELDVASMDEWLTTSKMDIFDTWNGIRQAREMAKTIPDYFSSARSL